MVILQNDCWVLGQQQMGIGVAQSMQSQTQMMPQLGNTTTATMLQYPQAYQQSQLGQLQQVWAKL